MPKRFTDTGKWRDDWFAVLTHQMKLVWLYLCDECDHAGIYKPNLRTMQFDLGMTVSQKEIFEELNNGKERVKVLENGRWFVVDFIKFQYPKGLVKGNKCHDSIIRLLEINGLELRAYLGPNKGLPSPCLGVKDKDKDKVKVKVNKKGGCGGKTFQPPSSFEVQKYCLDKNIKINPQRFVDYYQASGWKRGNTPIKDWKACVRTWVLNDREREATKPKSSKQILREALKKREEQKNDRRRDEENGPVHGTVRGELREDALRQ